MWMVVELEVGRYRLEMSILSVYVVCSLCSEMELLLSTCSDCGGDRRTEEL